MPDMLDSCKHFGPGLAGAGVEKMGGRAFKGLRGVVTGHEMEGAAYLQRSPTGQTIASMCIGGSCCHFFSVVLKIGCGLRCSALCRLNGGGVGGCPIMSGHVPVSGRREGSCGLGRVVRSS